MGNSNTEMGLSFEFDRHIVLCCPVLRDGRQRSSAML